MEHFCERHQAHVLGTLSGIDRVLLLGTLRSISYSRGLGHFLSKVGVLFVAFASFALALADRLKAHARQLAASHGRPFCYLSSAAISKEERARQLLAANPISEGLVCVLTCVEPCRSVDFRKGADGKLAPHFLQRKCLFLYFYFLDPEFGLCHVRLQTWFPFCIQVCLNGREWLARQLDREGIGYEKVGNCFTRIDDLGRAQQLMDTLQHLDWRPLLERFARAVNPLVRAGEFFERGYYWTVRQSEVATDVLFDSPESLAAIYPRLVRYSIEEMQSGDVLGYLGRQTNSRFSGSVETRMVRRTEGVRVKHWVEENSIKMYDKAGSVLRVETTINNPERLRVRRERESTGELGWLPMRKGLCDWTRREQASRAANARYLEALSVVGEQTPSAKLLDEVSGRVEEGGRPYRGLRPIEAGEAAIYELLLRGQYAVEGVSNAQIRAELYREAKTVEQVRQASGRVTRWLQLLRAHGLLTKVPKRHRYRVTRKGQAVMATALRIRASDCALLAA